VPIASLLTVTLTVYFQNSQLQTEGDKTEDGRWHDVIGLTAKPHSRGFDKSVVQCDPMAPAQIGSLIERAEH
jgi:hypothetical protein